MIKSFHRKRANELLGIFVLLTFALIAAAVVLGPHTRQWLTPSRKLAIRLPREGSLGLRKGADVLILGSVVGSVDDILVNDAGDMEADVIIRGNFIRFVRLDSRALIRKPLGIGDASIEITRGTGAPVPVDGAEIESSSDKAPTQMLEETLEDIRTEAVPALREMRAAVREYTLLASDLRAEQPALIEAIGHFNHIAASAQAGQGVAGMLLTDPAPAQSLRESISKLVPAIDNIQATSVQMQKVVAALPALEQSSQKVVDQTPALLLQVNESFRQVQRLAEEMQHNWLLGGTRSPAAPSPSIPADQVGTDR